MAKAKKFELEDPVPLIDDEDEDEETLAAIDEGIRDAGAGRTVPSEQVRKLLPQWISAVHYTQRALNDLTEIIPACQLPNMRLV